jgi:hypothetical protein
VKPAVVAVLASLTAALCVAPAAAQVDGSVSLLFDVMPDVGDAPGRQSVSELRARVAAERRQDLGDRVRVVLSGYVDGLIANRDPLGSAGTATDAVIRPADAYVEISTSGFDVRAGASRLVWGRLDEFQPTDVVNPIDLTRFLLEGRSEARLAVGLVRGRVFMPRSSTLEAVVVPGFRASRFDQLDEHTSPFNLSTADGSSQPPLPAPVSRSRSEPGLAWRSVQGGVRFTSTVSRLDWGVSAYRGFRTFPIVTLETGGEAVTLIDSFPRFTMVGGDFETVRGAWGVRGEAAFFVSDTLQSVRAVRGIAGRSLDAGIGVDRRAGDYRLAANVLWSWRGVDPEDPAARALAADEELHGADATLVLVGDRSFARDTRTVRVLAVYDPTDGTVFGRTIAAISLRDNLWLEGSAGLFAGSAADAIGRLTRRDFVYTRVKIFF